MKIFNESPREFNTEDELVEWLEWDLYNQRLAIADKKNIVYDKNISNDDINNYLKPQIEDNELCLNIGSSYKENFVYNIKIKFDFNFVSLLSNFRDFTEECNFAISVINTIFENKVLFLNFTFNKNVRFLKSIFHKKVDFICTTFNKKIDFLGTTFNEKVDLSHSTLNEELLFLNINFNEKVDFSHSILNGYINFHNFIFYKEIDFLGATFNEKVNFSSTSFNGKVNFSGATFNKKINFLDTSFNGEVSFSGTTFNGKVNFLSSYFNVYKNNNSICFNNIIIMSNSYVLFDSINNKDKNSHISKIEIKNVIIKGHLEFRNFKINEIDLKGSEVVGGSFNSVNFEFKPLNWQTASFLKHEYIKKDNMIEALEYKAIEKDLHAKEIFSTKNKTIQEWGEYCSIVISKLSNNHGQNWFQAVIFTLLSGFLFFSCSLVCLSFNSVNFIDIVFGLLSSSIIYVFCLSFYSTILDILNMQEKHNSKVHTAIIVFIISMILLMGKNIDAIKITSDYFKYLIPTNFDMFNNVYINNFWFNIFFYIFLILGKISVSYGIVEIVQAFRKFNSKSN